MIFIFPGIQRSLAELYDFKILISRRDFVKHRLDFCNIIGRHILWIRHIPTITRIKIQKCIRPNPVKSHCDIPPDSLLVQNHIISSNKRLLIFIRFIFCIIQSNRKQAPEIIYIVLRSILLKPVKCSFQIIQNRNAVKRIRDSSRYTKLRSNALNDGYPIGIANSLVEQAEHGKRIYILWIVIALQLRQFYPNIHINLTNLSDQLRSRILIR